MKVVIHVNKASSRVQYIFSLLLTDLLGLEIEVTEQKNEFTAHEGPKFSYGEKPLGGELFVQSNGFLSEAGVTEKSITFISFNGTPAFFSTSDERSVFPFDLFAASFYLVTRYEEYLPFKQDEYGRYPVIESTASRGGFLRIPLINTWTDLFGIELLKRFPGLQIKERKFKFISTIDIDHAYAFKHRNVIRTVGGLGRSVLNRKWKQLGMRISVLFGFKKDPYDTYEYIHQVHKDHNLHPLFFILYSQRSRHDNNVTLTSKAFQHLVKSLNHHGVVGIHPSLGSNKHFSRLESEVVGLAEVLGHTIYISRQHFLKISFPKTYQNLINVGIRHDYSMGYPSEPGFKASIAEPYRFYNLINETATNLLIHPLILMDVTLRDYYRLDPSSAVEFSKSLIDAAKAVNGEFVCLWHNENLSETGRWKGWRNVFEEILKYTAEKTKGK